MMQIVESNTYLLFYLFIGHIEPWRALGKKECVLWANNQAAESVIKALVAIRFEVPHSRVHPIKSSNL